MFKKFIKTNEALENDQTNEMILDTYNTYTCNTSTHITEGEKNDIF